MAGLAKWVRATALRMILLPAFTTSVMAAEAPATMHQFNVTCPAAKLAPALDRAYHECRNGYDIPEGGCPKFLTIFKQLLPTYDCQRPFDASPTKNYVVPAIWLTGDAEFEDYTDLLWRMASRKDRMFGDKSFREISDSAQRLFASHEFRDALDGALAEEYLEKSKKLQRTVGKSAP